MDSVKPIYPKGGGGYKDFKIQKYFGGSAACMKRLEMDTKGCVQMTSNDTYFDDSWFSSVTMDEEYMAA